MPAEKALNAYVDAANAWSHCILGFSCSMKQVKPRLQAKWATASLKIETAKAGMNRPKP